MRKLLFATMLTIKSLTVVLAATPGTLAEERACRGTLGAVTVDNLRVPQNTTCTLNGTRVQGNIIVERNATLNARNIRVVGALQAENARSVNVRRDSRINGDVQIKQGGSAVINDTRIGGTLLFDSNSGSLTANQNVISGSLQAFQNSGGVTIANNRIDENLQCKANTPPPTGGNNVVQGNKEDQCRRL